MSNIKEEKFLPLCNSVVNKLFDDECRGLQTGNVYNINSQPQNCKSQFSLNVAIQAAVKNPIKNGPVFGKVHKPAIVVVSWEGNVSRTVRRLAGFLRSNLFKHLSLAGFSHEEVFEWLNDVLLTYYGWALHIEVWDGDTPPSVEDLNVLFDKSEQRTGYELVMAVLDTPITETASSRLPAPENDVLELAKKWGVIILRTVNIGPSGVVGGQLMPETKDPEQHHIVLSLERLLWKRGILYFQRTGPNGVKSPQLTQEWASRGGIPFSETV